MTRFYDRNGRPLPLLRWGYLYGQRTYHIVARAVVTSATDPKLTYLVSTLWMGFDPDILRPPVVPNIYETVALTPHQILELERTATERQAILTHDAIVRRIAARIPDPVITHHPVVPSAPTGGWTCQR